MIDRAQISSEFFMFLGITFLIAIAFSLSSIDQLQDFRAERESEAVQDLALKLQKELMLAASVEDGYIRTFEIPDTIENVDFFLTVQNSTVLVKSKKSLFILPIPRTIGNFTKGINTINKTGEVIYINSGKISYFTSFSTCQSAENLGLCGGLDILFGPGYRCSCCSEHSFCCPC